METADTRVVYGATCMWWDDIDKVAHRPTRGGYTLPCCPHCRGPLFEMDSEAKFIELAERYEREKPAPGYVERLRWAKGRCFKTIADATAAFHEFKAQEV